MISGFKPVFHTWNMTTNFPAQHFHELRQKVSIVIVIEIFNSYLFRKEKRTGLVSAEGAQASNLTSWTWYQEYKRAHHYGTLWEVWPPRLPTICVVSFSFGPLYVHCPLEDTQCVLHITRARIIVFLEMHLARLNKETSTYWKIEARLGNNWWGKDKQWRLLGQQRPWLWAARSQRSYGDERPILSSPVASLLYQQQLLPSGITILLQRKVSLFFCSATLLPHWLHSDFLVLASCGQ